MLKKVWHFSLLWLGCAAQDLKTSEQKKTCPFPMADTIEPCSCKVDETNFKVSLACDIQQDMDEELLKKLNKAFACKKTLHEFNVNLNGNNWTTDFSQELLGEFKMSNFSLSNLTSITGNIKAGAFHGSSLSLEEFNIEGAIEGAIKGVIETGAFSELQTLRKVSLGNSFGTIQSKAFFELSSFEEFIVDTQTISYIETEAFYELPSLKSLDLSDQNFVSISSRAFYNLIHLTELNLSKNRIYKINVNTFYNLQSLVYLDLSSNTELTYIGNMFGDLKNQNLVVNFAGNNVKVLLKESFKMFIEMVTEYNGAGYIDMHNVPLQCTCDMKWLVTSNSSVFKNSSCPDGNGIGEVSMIIKYTNKYTTIQYSNIRLLHNSFQVDGTLLEELCPQDDCPGYDPGI